MILIAYDGSADAHAAIDRAAALFPGEPATVVTVWVPFIELLARTGSGLAFSPGMVDIDELDAATEANARNLAQEGVERAKDAGLNAQPRTRAQRANVAEAILVEAEELGASAIVVGTRGLTGLKSVLLGSVSHGVLHHAHIPVLVVPAADPDAAGTDRR